MQHPQVLPSIGIHMDGTSIDFAVVQGSTVIMRAESMRMADYPTPDAAINEIGARLLQLKKVFPSVVAVGMGLTGFANYELGSVHALTGVAGWHDIPIRTILTEISGLPCTIDNNAHCVAYAEWKLGAGKGCDDLVCLLLSEGIGAGIISGGHFLRGHLGTAGEVGQSSVYYRGRVGHYGNRGAIENYIGTQTLARDARIAYASEGISKSMEECQPYNLAASARAGCAIAQKLWDEVALKLASCMINCCYLLNPEAFILGGELTEAHDVLLPALKHHLSSQLFSTHFESLAILLADFGEEAGIIGAAQLALDTWQESECCDG